MGIFQQFPYSNFHEFNLDQIIKIMREMQDEWENTKTEWASYKDFIDNYFENLDVSAEVLAAMRIFAADGTLNQIMDPTIATETAAWLVDHITQPTTPAIDTSLTVAGAAADAKATGDSIRSANVNIENNTKQLVLQLEAFGNLNVTLLNDMTMNTSGMLYASAGKVVAYAPIYSGMRVTFLGESGGIMTNTACRSGYSNVVPVAGITVSDYVQSAYYRDTNVDGYIVFTHPSLTNFAATFENINSIANVVNTLCDDYYGINDELICEMMPNTAINSSTGQYFSQAGWTAGTALAKAGTYLTFYADNVVTNCRWTLFNHSVNNSDISDHGVGYSMQIPADHDYYIMISAPAVVSQFKITEETAGTQEKAQGYWKDKKIVWFGTSIPAGVVNAGDENGIGSYPDRIGKLLGATVYNEAVGSSRARAGSSFEITASDPLGWAGMSPLGILLSLSVSSAEKQDLYDNWSNTWSQIIADPAGTMSSITIPQLEAYKNTSWDIKLAKYLTGGSVGQCDLYVFDHGFNEAVLNHQFDDMSTDPPANDPTNRAYFQGAMNFLIKKILDDNYKAKILIIGHYMNAPKQGTTGMYLVKNDIDKCCDGQEKCAYNWGIPIIKTWEYMGISNNIINKNGTNMPVLFAYYPDGIHPASDTTGYALKYYADVLYPHIKNMR